MVGGLFPQDQGPSDMEHGVLPVPAAQVAPDPSHRIAGQTCLLTPHGE